MSGIFPCSARRRDARKGEREALVRQRQHPPPYRCLRRQRPRLRLAPNLLVQAAKLYYMNKGNYFKHELLR